MKLRRLHWYFSEKMPEKQDGECITISPASEPYFTLSGAYNKCVAIFKMTLIWFAAAIRIATVGKR
jgi:hypothetical protein